MNIYNLIQLLILQQLHCRYCAWLDAPILPHTLITFHRSLNQCMHAHNTMSYVRVYSYSQFSRRPCHHERAAAVRLSDHRGDHRERRADGQLLPLVPASDLSCVFMLR